MKNIQDSFQFVGNDLALDLVNTRVVVAGQTVDLIEYQTGFTAWLLQAGVKAQSDLWSMSDLQNIHRLRDVIRDMVDAKLDNVEPVSTDVELLNMHLAYHDFNLALSYGVEGFRLDEREVYLTPPMVMGLIASKAGYLLADNESNRLKACANPDCLLYFKDVSKSGRRRWCSMETCGNRSKASTFRANIPA